MDFPMRKLIIILAIILTACGGGSGTSNTSTASNLVDNFVMPLVATFSNDKTNIIELNTYYDSLCGGKTSIAQVIPVNLNGKTTTDFIITMYCDNKGMGTITSETMSRLILIKKQPNGNYSDVTKQILGSDYISLGGVPVTYVKHDFNKDGYEDVVFAINYEDGRTYNINGDQVKSQNTFLTSKKDGTYSITRLGTVAWNYQLRTVENEFGNLDVLSLPIGSNPLTNLYRYTDSGWVVHAENYSNNIFYGAESIVLSKNNGYTNNNLVVSKTQGSNFGFELFEKNLNWQSIDTHIFGTTIDIPWISWNGSLSTVKYMRYQSKDYVSMNFEKMCETKLQDNDNYTSLVVLMTAREVINGYNGQLLDESSNTTLKHVGKIIILNVSKGKFEIINSFDLSENIAPATHGIECKDINNDGNSDITIQNYAFNTEPTPIVLLGNGSGQYSRVLQNIFSNLNSYKNNLAGFVIGDITGDGLIDYLDFPVNGISTYNPSTKIYLSLRFGKSNFFNK